MEDLHTQGIAMPRLGFGTFRMQGDDARAPVESALDLGYRHIDTAEMYRNEEAVGAAVAASGIPRNEIHVTTKVWHENLAPDALRRAFNASLARLKLDFVDLYLIHWPAPGMDMGATFGALETIREQGGAKAIGVCNFTTPLLKTAIEEVGAPIACNQVEYHVYLDQTPLRDYLASKGVPLTAYAPLAHATVMDDPVLRKIGEKHGASAAQIALAWLLDQDGVAAIPKAQHKANQKANLDALRIALDDDDRQAIAALPKNQRRVNPPFAPDWDAPAV